MKLKVDKSPLMAGTRLHEHVIMPNIMHGIMEIAVPAPVGANNHSPDQTVMELGE